jgi:NodT family efflux transporter outer membrane factor (OMF) lipoprotein
MNRFAPFALVLALGGCMPGSAYHPPALTAAAAPEDRREAVPDAAWWSAFGDPALPALLAEALAGNPDLAAARARMARADAAARGAGAALLPSLSAGADVAATSMSLDDPIGQIAHALNAPRGYQTYAPGVSASWDIDIAGGARRARQAAGAEAEAAAADREAAAIAITAQVAQAWLAWRTAATRLVLAEASAADARDIAALTAGREAEGLSAAIEVNRADAGARAAGEDPIAARLAMAMAEARLTALVGRMPGDLTARLQAPAPALGPGAALAGDVDLRRRPDIRAAERRLAASHARVGVALAEYYPHVSLSALIGTSSETLGNVFAAGAVQGTAGLGIGWRLFDFGRVDAEVAGARGAEAEALAAWRGAVLGGARDVEQALAGLHAADAALALRQNRLAALARAETRSHAAFDEGNQSRLSWLQARRARLAGAIALEDAAADRREAAVRLWLALGGWNAQPALALNRDQKE